MIELTITEEELKEYTDAECRKMFIETKLRQAGIPITGFINISNLHRGILTKETLDNGIVKFIWSE